MWKEVLLKSSLNIDIFKISLSISISISIFSTSPYRYRYRYRYRYFPKSPYRYRYRYFWNCLIDIDIDIDIFKNDHIDIDIFQKCRYIDNRYVISIYRTGLCPRVFSNSLSQAGVQEYFLIDCHVNQTQTAFCSQPIGEQQLTCGPIYTCLFVK